MSPLDSSPSGLDVIDFADVRKRRERALQRGGLVREDPFGKGAAESEERQPEGRRYVSEGEKQVPRLRLPAAGRLGMTLGWPFARSEAYSLRRGAGSTLAREYLPGPANNSPAERRNSVSAYSNPPWPMS